MKDKYNPQIGILKVGEEKFNFYLDNYTVTFMKTDSSSVQLEGPFVYGHTFDYKQIMNLSENYPYKEVYEKCLV